MGYCPAHATTLEYVGRILVGTAKEGMYTQPLLDDKFHEGLLKAQNSLKNSLVGGLFFTLP